MATLLELNGAGPQKQPRYAPIFMDRSFTGLYTQRAVVHDPADIMTSKYYGGRPDALWAGANIELTNRLTLQRRPGLINFTTTGATGFVYPTTPLTAYSFQLIDTTIRVIVDTGSTGISASLTLASVATSVSGEAVYTGTITGGANNAFVNTYFTVSGFTTTANNGVFVCVASTLTTLTLLNASAVAESHAATAASIILTGVTGSSTGSTVYAGTISGGGSNAFVGLKFVISGFTNGPNNGTFVCTASSATTLTLTTIAANGSIITTITETATANAISYGASYWDHQDGTATLLFAKSALAGQTHFIGSGGILYAGNGVETWKYTPLNTNGTIWKWGIVAPTNQPSVQIVASGAAATQWQANTIFSTMGFTYDSTNHILWQLKSVNADPSNPNVANAVFGTAGPGGPAWNQSLYGVTTDGATLTWQNKGQLQNWQALTVYGDAGTNSTAGVCFVADTTTSAIYANFWGAGQLSRSGNKKPPFSATPGWRYWEQGSDGAGGGGYKAPYWYFFCTFAQAKAWLASHAYASYYSSAVVANTVVEPFILPPPTTGVGGNPPTPVYMQVTLGAHTSGTGSGPFPATVSSAGQLQTDGQLQWQSIVTLFSSTYDSLWHAATAYVKWTIPGGTFGAIFDGTNIQVCTGSTGAGLSGSKVPGTVVHSAATMANSGSSAGLATITLAAGSWTNTPVAGDQISVSGFANATNNGAFLVSSATSNTIVVASNLCVTEAVATVTITFNPWGTAYNNTTLDGNLVWTCVGPPVAWVAGSSTTGIWNLPLAGWAPPQISQPYGGSTVSASNGTVQTVTVSGKSGTPSAPTWGLPPNTVSEGPSSPQLTWIAESLSSANSLSWKLGYSYGYSYKARALNDIYSPLPLGGINGVAQIPPGRDPATGGFGGALGPPLGSETNAVSSASPANTFTGPNAGAVNFVSGTYSTDPQVDTIIIWRSVDGGGPNQMFELTEIPNIPGGGTWTFQDFLPDAPNGTFPGLNTNIPAPINGVNNPPAAVDLPMVYNYTRIWCASGQFVSFSGGPDTLVGNPDEAFKVSNALPFLAPVTRVIKTPQGLVTFLTDSIEVIAGGPSTASFFSVTWAPGIGLLSYNALDVFAGEQYFFGSDNQFRVMTPSLSIQNAGFPLGDQFANQPTSGSMSSGLTMTWDPSQAYVASHQSGTDNAIFVADGNTGWYRCNPRQAGALAQGEPVWSPYAIITNGCQMVQSVEIKPGIKKLLVGSQTPHQSILMRDQTVFTDNGTQYNAFFEMGNITLAHPGQLALLKFCEFDFSTANFKPTISYLLNETSGTFTSFTANPIFDPPSLYGLTITPQSYSPNRYYFASNASLARCRHLRLKVNYGLSSNGDEMYNATIFGRLMIEV